MFSSMLTHVVQCQISVQTIYTVQYDCENRNTLFKSLSRAYYTLIV